MIERIALDSGPLGRLVHPRLNLEISEWLDGILDDGVIVYLPEIVDYEVRRGLLAAGMTRSLKRLDQFREALSFLPIQSDMMLDAADLWAQARKGGYSVADPKELDGDVILAAQSRHVNATVATENVGHLSLFVEARHWRDIPVGIMEP